MKRKNFKRPNVEVTDGAGVAEHSMDPAHYDDAGNLKADDCALAVARAYRPPAPSTYHIYVEPRPPRTSIGLIATAKRTQAAERATCTVGKIVAVGDLAWKLKTADMDPAQCTVAQSFKVGDWIHYRQHAGQKLRIHPPGGPCAAADEDSAPLILVMSDTDVLGKFEDEAHARQFFDWV